MSNPFNRVKKLINKIVICLNSIIQTTTLLIIIFHIYAIIGMIFFSFETNTVRRDSDFAKSLGNFDTYGESLLLLLLVITENGWSEIIYDYSYSFEQDFFIAAFFISFHLIVKIVLISLLTGLIWEIFTIISEFMEDEKIYFNASKAKIQNEVQKDKERREELKLIKEANRRKLINFENFARVVNRRPESTFKTSELIRSKSMGSPIKINDKMKKQIEREEVLLTMLLRKLEIDMTTLKEQIDPYLIKVRTDFLDFKEGNLTHKEIEMLRDSYTEDSSSEENFR